MKYKPQFVIFSAIAVFMPILISHSMDLEIQTAKMAVVANLYADIIEDFCYLEEMPFACKTMQDLEYEISVIRSVEFVFINYENFRNEYLHSKECGKIIDYWQEERTKWYMELNEV